MTPASEYPPERLPELLDAANDRIHNDLLVRLDIAVKALTIITHAHRQPECRRCEEIASTALQKIEHPMNRRTS